MNEDAAAPFNTIESAHDFVTLLAVTVAEAKREVTTDIRREINGTAWRRLDALRIAEYNLERLEAHLKKSARLLNDLRSVRRLLFEERGRFGTVVTMQPKPAPHSAVVPKNGHPVAAA